MHVVDRTSVQVYFAQAKSSIHVPPRSGIDPDVVDWILTNEDIRFLDPNNSNHIEVVRNDLKSSGKDLTPESVVLHLSYLKDSLRRDESDSWDELAARAHELDVFTNVHHNFLVPDSRFLEFSGSDVTSLDPSLFGPKGIIENVVAMTRLTETRVQDGFTRYSPKPVPQLVGFERMWGHSKQEGSWLPAYRAYGEGILFQFNVARLSNWLASAGLKEDPQEIRRGLSAYGILAHSLAHLMMTRLSNECGYALPSIQDRLYDLPDGRVAVLVYTTDSDILGTLGGLVDFATGEKLESLVRGAFEEARWCSQDPVCISREVNPTDKQGSCCHQCLFLPETSCELRNQYLDRATLVGSSERNIAGVLTTM